MPWAPSEGGAKKPCDLTVLTVDREETDKIGFEHFIDLLCGLS